MTKPYNTSKEQSSEAGRRECSDLSGTVRATDSRPCLYSNNSIQPPSSTSQPLNSDSISDCIQACTGLLSPYHKRQAETLHLNVKRLVETCESPNNIAFLTLTFAENITDPKEAYSRLRSFKTNFLSKNENYGNYVQVTERQKRGALHYHLVIQLAADIKTGFNFDQYDEWLKGSRKKGTFPTGNDYIKTLWHELSENLEKYGLGRIFSLEPIRSNTDAIARYVGKYVSKHLGSRTDEDKGLRLINYSRGWTKNSVRFAWHTKNASLWRAKLELFAKHHGCSEFYQLHEKLGTGWAYRYADDIMNIVGVVSNETSSYEYEDSTVLVAEKRKYFRDLGKVKAIENGEFLAWTAKQSAGNRQRKLQSFQKQQSKIAVEQAKIAFLADPDFEEKARFIRLASELDPVPF